MTATRGAQRLSERHRADPTTVQAPTFTTASPQCPSSVSSYVSAPNVENVVYAPRKPITSPRESQDGAWRASTTIATTSPFRKQPEMLIVNVAHGKSESAWCSISESSPKRASAPRPPPAATARTTGMVRLLSIG